MYIYMIYIYTHAVIPILCDICDICYMFTHNNLLCCIHPAPTISTCTVGVPLQPPQGPDLEIRWLPGRGRMGTGTIWYNKCNRWVSIMDQ